MNNEISDAKKIAFLRLKGKIVKLIFEFTEEYNDKNNINNLSPDTKFIIIDVLTSCLDEIQYQLINYHPFTSKQIDHICYQIGEWYLMMKPLLEENHNLGFMKEKLKTMICGE